MRRAGNRPARRRTGSCAATHCRSPATRERGRSKETREDKIGDPEGCFAIRRRGVAVVHRAESDLRERDLLPLIRYA
jgi:hypothetical protein